MLQNVNSRRMFNLSCQYLPVLNLLLVSLIRRCSKERCAECITVHLVRLPVNNLFILYFSFCQQKYRFESNCVPEPNSTSTVCRIVECHQQRNNTAAADWCDKRFCYSTGWLPLPLSPIHTLSSVVIRTGGNHWPHALKESKTHFATNWYRHTGRALQ